MLRKISFLIVCLSLGTAGLLSAQSKVETLKSALTNAKQDTSKTRIYLDLYEELKFEDPEQASDYLKKSLDLSSRIKYEKGLLDALLSLGDFLDTSSRYDSSLVIFKQAEQLAKKLSDRKGIIAALIGRASNLVSLQQLPQADSIASIALEMAIAQPTDSLKAARSYGILGGIDFYRGQLDGALNYYQKSLAYNSTDRRRKAKTLLNIGMIHYRLNDLTKADNYYSKGLDQALQTRDLRTVALLYDYIGLLKSKMKNYEEAEENYDLAMKHYKLVDDKSNMAHVHVSRAGIYDALADYDQAIIEYQKALALLNETNYPLGECYTLYNLGMAYFNKKDYERAEEYYLKAKPMAIELEILHVNKSLAQRLSELYAVLGNYEKAYEFHREFKVLDDSVFNEAKASRIAELEEKYQNNQKQQEIELLSAENKIAALEIQKQETLRNSLIVAAIFLILLIIVIYNRYQIKSHSIRKLRELDQLKSTFYTNISHEFRTPLALILSPLQSIFQMKLDKEIEEPLSTIQRNATHLTELTNQILSLSKLEAGKLTLNVHAGNFKSFINVLIASFDSLADANKIEFVRNIEEAPEDAYFDEDKVYKILTNLLSNAFKFTSPKGKVIVSVRQQDSQLQVSITDTGMGIPLNDQPLVFKRFYQYGSDKPMAAGTGIGLTLSKELALLHKGDIILESKEGVGSTFTFQFPFKKSAYSIDEIVESPSAYEPLARLTPIAQNGDSFEHPNSDKIILIIEDNSELRQHMLKILKDEYIVKLSVDGQEGIKDALQIIPDIIVTDLMMPGLDGIELCNTLKENEKTSHIPIILLTAKADRETKLDGLKTGADDFLTKPFDNEELQVRISNLIQQREQLKSKYAQTLLLASSNIIIQSADERFIKKALEVADENLSDSEFSVEDFQKEMGMSRMQLHRKLKALTGHSASEFIRDLRLQRVATLIKENHMNISESAYSCGFNNLSYFNQCFKEKFGHTPSEHAKKSA